MLGEGYGDRGSSGLAVDPLHDDPHELRSFPRSTLIEGYVGCPPRSDRMHSIGSYVLRGAGCHECEDRFIWGSAPYLDVVLDVVGSSRLCISV
eukprot:3250960-Pleurochrysis_carterae.AAC.1